MSNGSNGDRRDEALGAGSDNGPARSLDTGSFDVAALQFRPSWASANDGPTPQTEAPLAAASAVAPLAAGDDASAPLASAAVAPSPVVLAPVVAPPAVAAPTVAAPAQAPTNVANAVAGVPATALSASNPGSANGVAANGVTQGAALTAPKAQPSPVAAPAAVRPVTVSATPQADDDDYVLPTPPSRNLYVAGGVGALALVLLAVMMFSGSKEEKAPLAANTRVTSAAPQEPAPPARVVTPPSPAPSPPAAQLGTPVAPVVAAPAPTPQAIPIVQPPKPVEETAAAPKVTKSSKRKRERAVAPVRPARTTTAARVAAPVTKPAASRSRTPTTAKPKRGAGLVNTNPY